MSLSFAYISDLFHLSRAIPPVIDIEAVENSEKKSPRKRPARIQIPFAPLSITEEISKPNDEVAEIDEEGEEYSVYCKRGKRGSMEDRYSAVVDLQGDTKQLIKAIDEYEGEDPLQPWFACIKWVQDAFPPGGDCSGLVVILEQCVRTFWHEEQYKNDIRYLKVWLEYAGYCDDAEVVYGFLNTNKIGEMHAIFYISYATHLESKNKIKTANNIYECGIARNAQPIEKLKSAYRKFFTRSMSRPKAIEEESMDTCQPTRSFGTILTKADSGNRPLDSCEIARKRQKQEGCSHDFRVLNKAIDY
ncbi:hypothetical protein LXL04_015691 [Taraxacum kok-saghyz]